MLNPIDPMMFWICTTPVGAVVALLFAFLFYRGMMRSDPGDEAMQRIAGHVKSGSRAYLFRQYKVVLIVLLILGGLLAVLAWGLHVLPPLVPFVFLTGGILSALAGWFGMSTATSASNRTAAGAKHSLDRALRVAFRSGAVMGMVVVGLVLLGISAWFFALYWYHGVAGLKDAAARVETLNEITMTLLAFGMGASLQALFARVGGGIFTKAADVGADLVGKIEAGIPEDDPRNPATIADNVGDNVGDVAGMGADLYESYASSILATAALGVAAAAALQRAQPGNVIDPLPLLLAPMILAGIGVFCSIVGVYMVRTREGAGQKELMRALNRGIWIGSALVVGGAFATIYLLGLDLGIFWAMVVGLAAGLLIGHSTEYFTSADYRPTLGIASQAQTGPATVIIDGTAVGMLSTGIPVLVISLAILLAYGFCGGFHPDGNGVNMGLYGIGIAAVGMLSTLGLTLATDAYGPIADNAGGNAEMTGQPPEVRQRTDALDSLGNTTAAIGKGFAIGSAALTALALLAAYTEQVRHGLDVVVQEARASGDPGALAQVQGLIDVTSGNLREIVRYYDIQPLNPRVLVGMFFGAALAFVFCALTIKAVGRAAGAMVEEVRRQFREIPGIMEGEAEPDYARCVAISTASAQREMLIPSLLAVITPVATGLVLGVAGVMGLLTGTLVTGFLLAVFMANAGGAWDNAKKYIEAGAYGGKGSDAHKASVVGDTVGDPFKDTSGPSLNILIKIVSMTSVISAGFVVRFGPVIGEFLGLGKGVILP